MSARGAGGSRKSATPAVAPTPVPSLPSAEISLRSPWMLLVAVVAAACLVVSVSYRIYDPDIWQNLTVGRAIWEQKRVPTTQLWSWPTYGQPDVKWTWGFSALAWPVWEAWGVWGLYAWRWVTTLVSFGFLWAAARALGARGLVPLVVMVVCGLVWRARSQVRPETLAAVLLAAQVWVLEARRQGGKDRTGWLVPIAWAWANVHNTWFLGFGLTGIHLLHDLFARRAARAPRPAQRSARAGHRGAAGAGATAVTPGGGPPRARTGVPGIVARAMASRGWLLWVGTAALAISFANPYGWRALWQPFDFFINRRNEVIFSTIGEMGPIEWHGYWPGLRLVFVVWPLLILLRWRRRGFDVVEVLSCLLFSAVALRAQRFLGFYALMVVPYLARAISEAWATWARAPRFGPALRAALASFACLAAGLSEWMRPGPALGVGFVWNQYPVAACDFMEAKGIRGRGFNQFGFAGYQIYRFWPDRTRMPFMDIHQSGTRQDRDQYAWAQQRPDVWRELDHRYEFDYALLQRVAFERNAMLDMLDADSTWALVFLDDVMALYVRRAGPLAALAESLAYRHIPGGARGLGPLGEACARDSVLRGEVAAELERATKDSPQHAQALILLATLASEEGRIGDTRTLLERALLVDAGRAGVNRRLGLVALAEGRPRDALRYADRERALTGPSAALEVIAGRAWRAVGEIDRARAAYRRAIARDSSQAEARDSLAALART